MDYPHSTPKKVIWSQRLRLQLNDALKPGASRKQVVFASYPMTHPDADQQAWLEEHRMVLNPARYYSQIEVVAAAGVSLRIGFNPGELLDFFLGWFGVDTYHDDPSRLKAPE
jgi:hypothetical protein